jgi:hypothetical protein
MTRHFAFEALCSSGFGLRGGAGLVEAGDPPNRKRSVMLSYEQFRFAFGGD